MEKNKNTTEEKKEAKDLTIYSIDSVPDAIKEWWIPEELGLTKTSENVYIRKVNDHIEIGIPKITIGNPNQNPKDFNLKDLNFLDGIFLTYHIFNSVLKKRLSDRKGNLEKDKDGADYLGVINDDIHELLICKTLEQGYYKDLGSQLFNRFGIEDTNKAQIIIPDTINQEIRQLIQNNMIKKEFNYKSTDDFILQAIDDKIQADKETIGIPLK